MTRYFIRTQSKAHFSALSPMFKESLSYVSRSEPEVVIADLPEEEANRLSGEGAELIPSRQYEPFPIQPTDYIYQPLEHHPRNLTDVLRHNKADQAWAQSRGAGVHIAIVDTGICGSMAEFPAAKRSPHSWAASGLGSAWTDMRGHGSMTGGVAAATTASHGRYNGVAPDASLISCKTSFDDTELYQIYDHLIQLVTSGKIGRLVVNNSYGAYQCSPPAISLTDPFPAIVQRAMTRGIVPVFAAGNNHVVVCANQPSACGPNTIWGVNSVDDVICVGTVNENNVMDQPPASPGGYTHRDSSRGPGQFAHRTTKPDCVAPTYGEVIWGCGYTAMEWWGTSGAAPQVAGLAALMLAKDSTLTPRQIQDIITQTCVALPVAASCAGSGLIDCRAAVAGA
ncbi:MAG: S8 family serine peptidase [Pyrinomonadaceae bacterium]